MRLAIITTHPIQYYAPIFTRLAKEPGISIKVFYTWEKDAALFDPGFGKEVVWDIPLLEGYDHCFVSNEGRKGRGFWDMRNPELIREIEDWGAWAVMIIGWNYRSHLRAMRYFKNRIPVIFKGDSTLLDEQHGMKTGLRRAWLKYVYKHIDHALYVGESNKQYFLKHGLKDAQLVLAPHAIDNDRFSKTDAEQAAFIEHTKKTMGIDADCVTILYCGKFQDKKDPLILLKAFRTLPGNHLHLVMVGNGELEEQVKAESEPDPRIHLLPFQNQSLMPAIYRLGNLFCLPSRGPGETWGLAVNEAMACGLPVLVSDKAGCAVDLVQPGSNGFIFSHGNQEDLAGKLKMMTSDKTRLKQMGEQSALRIKNWNYDNLVAGIQKALIP